MFGLFFIEDLRDEEGREVNGMYDPWENCVLICSQRNHTLEIPYILHELIHYFICKITNNFDVHWRFDHLWYHCVGRYLSK